MLHSQRIPGTRLALILLLLVVAVAVAGCGGNY
jgi:hypothetical protein